ncbi:MAG: SIMPL domain-containing protein [Paramuribaculum sp.]|nr:SIMPL domain-containing protein [Paramuribaculum sp.]MDE5835984.1 SIMPL domain-containing protein [Paramuribaculum sp.]
MKRNNTIIAALLLTAGLIALGLCLRSGLYSFSSRDRVVDVKGLAEREVAANKVTWPIMFKEVGNDLPTVYQKVTATNAQIVEFLKTNGLTEQEISIGAPAVQDLTTDRYNNNPLPYNYAVTSIVTVSSSKVREVHNLINRQGELFSKGIAITNNYQTQISYDYTDLNSIKPEMIAEATENAREAAKKFADDSDSQLGKIKTARQGQFTIEDRDPTTPYIKKVRVVTSLTYYLED